MAVVFGGARVVVDEHDDLAVVLAVLEVADRVDHHLLFGSAERLRKWTADGTWDRILEHVIVKDDSLGTLDDNVAFVVSVDSTSVRAHQHAAGARKKGCADWIEDLAIDGECLGRSRGGLATKRHLAVDAAGLPLAVILTPGQAGDNP